VPRLPKTRSGKILRASIRRKDRAALEEVAQALGR
jgi:acyl-coenzyme A synthetase/AMP-(fatty) acid ligase